MPRWVVNEREEDEESSSEEGSDDEVAEEGEEEEGEDEEGDDDDAEEERPVAPAASNKRRKVKKITISLRNQQVCHVCGKSGHQAGFVGAKYLDCPNKPCYLCKQPGHTTATCPHRIAPETGCTAAVNTSSNNMLFAMRKREKHGRTCQLWRCKTDFKVDAAVLKLHSRRCTVLEFHPTQDNLVVSGDKKGQVAVWDFDRVYERTVYNTIHRALTNSIRFLHSGDGMSCVTGSSDGTCKVVDIETGCAETLLDLNPGGWIEGVSNERTWGMIYGLDVINDLHLVVAGDRHGVCHLLDNRAKKPLGKVQMHKKGSKVTGIHAHPLSPSLMLTSGSDHMAQLMDIRTLSMTTLDNNNSNNTSRGKNAVKGEVPGRLAVMHHPRVVNSAYFSPRTGSRLITTCQDNRIRVWDNVLKCDQPPDREIVHSHDFNRYLTPFKAEWDPKDWAERTLVVGRYISEDFGGVALHPVDIMDAATGKLLAELVDANLTTICPVNKPHPVRDVIVTGSSRSLYAWRAQESECDEVRAEGGIRGGDASSSGDAGALIRGSANFVFFDADEDTKRQKKAQLHESGAVTSGGQPEEQEEEEDEEELPKSKKKTKRTPRNFVDAKASGTKKKRR